MSSSPATSAASPASAPVVGRGAPGRNNNTKSNVVVPSAAPPRRTRSRSISRSTTMSRQSSLSRLDRADLNVPLLRKSLAYAKDRVVRARCSWCFKETLHGRVQRNLIRRDVFKCLECVRPTLLCQGFGCQAMTRGHAEWDDALCALCDGTIDDWDAPPDEFERLGFCSWCFSFEAHSLHIRNLLRRDGYHCQGCNGSTALCMSCSQAFTRCTAIYDDKLCLVCDGTLPDWKDAQRNAKIASEQDLEVLKKHDPFASYAPMRRHVSVRFHVDGASFYEALADAIEGAKRSVYMSFWHLNDKIYLRRFRRREADRFDSIVTAAAERGVCVCILLWRENSAKFAVDNFSSEMKTAFESLHANVHVARAGHPEPWSCVWSHHQKFAVVDERIAFVGGLDVCLGRYDTPEHVLSDPDRHVWPGIDYYNPHISRPSSLDGFLERDEVDRQTVPRMPWHDVQVEIRGGLAPADIAQNFIERWTHALRVHYASNENMPRLKPTPVRELRLLSEEDDTGTCVVRAVRSLDVWGGAEQLEKSVLGAYLKHIREAEHFIYIENQYLSSSFAGGGVTNTVVNALYEKLVEKISAHQTFRVIVVLPHPEETGEAAYSILAWQYQTINRGGSSLLEQLTAEFPEVNLREFITFYFLRNYTLGGGGDGDNDLPQTEKVFVHSKLMIVDDRIALVGSANLNDRSLLGDRDSELGLVIQDEDTIESRFDGEVVRVAKAVHSFRMRLMAEHLGMLDDGEEKYAPLLRDVGSTEFYDNLWFKVAKKNTSIYEKIFPSIPRDCYTTLEKYKAAGGHDLPHKAVADGHNELKRVRGLLTLHPLLFLNDEDLRGLTGKVLGEYVFQ